MKNNSNNSKKEVILEGMATSPGIAIGPVYIFNPYAINLSELELEIDDIDGKVGTRLNKSREEIYFCHH